MSLQPTRPRDTVRWLSRLALVGATTLAACTGLIGGEPSPVGEEAVIEQTTPSPGGLRRLTAEQYVASIEVLLGAEAALAAQPPDDTELHGYDVIAAAELALPGSAVEQYELSAREVAEVAVATGVGPACTATGPGDRACMETFVERFGRLAWRRPLEPSEIDLVVDAAIASATHEEVQSFEAGVTVAIATFLQSPYFLYIVELGSGEDERRWLTPHELVARMSFFLLGATPDDAALRYAEDRDLTDPEVVRELARSMMADDRARASLRRFFSARYRLDDLHTISKNADAFPEFTPALGAAMREETLRLVEDVVFTRDVDAREIFLAEHTFVDDGLAALYGFDAPTSGFAKRSLDPAEGRAGVFGHASWLTRLSHPATTSPTRRGLYVRRSFLCDDVPPPPPGVETNLPDEPPDMTEPTTKREQLKQHQEDPTCAACHRQIDDIGLALEHYDAIGRYRETDGGATIDTDSAVEDIGAFSSAAELATLIADDPRAMRCFVLQMFRGSMGHLETVGEQASVDALVEAFDASGHRISELMVELTASPAFRLVGPPK